MRVAVLGLGEAGATYARGLQERGADVVGFDPRVRLGDVPFATSDAAAVTGADLVLSLVTAAEAAEAADEVAPYLGDALFADMNTASPGLKRSLAAELATRGAAFTDVAILYPVPRAGVRTPLLASGDGAARFADAVAPLGLPVEVVGAGPGDAAGLKLLRSVFMKGLAGLVLEGLEAAERIGAEEWLRAQIASELGADGDRRIDRMLAGTRRHAARRAHEMRDVREYLDAVESPTWMTEGTIRWLDRVTAEGAVNPS
jgi:3-hydroxyisobutyrate dehydrogenase-like beta-hydroxyacid dehydrogenase